MMSNHTMVSQQGADGAAASGPSQEFIPFSVPALGVEEEAAVAEALSEASLT